MQNKKRDYDIRLIALDLDGTLFNEKKEVTAYTLQTLQEAVRAGIQVVASTGRPFYGIPFDVLGEIGAKYAITANGAAVYDIQERRCLYSDGMDRETVFQIIDMLDGLDLRMDMIMDGQGYTEARQCKDTDRLDLSEPMKEYLRRTRKPIVDYRSFIDEKESCLEKITLSFYPLPDGTYKEADHVRRLFAKLRGLHVVSGGYSNMEISKDSATKGNALRMLAKQLGIDISQTMACGDAENDMDMIRAAGIGVAMGNASEDVKEAADFITRSNREDGVAYAVRTLVF